MAYLLDTNILSDIIRNPSGTSARRAVLIGDGNVFTSIVVAAELRFGLRKGGAAWMFELDRGVAGEGASGQAGAAGG